MNFTIIPAESPLLTAAEKLACSGDFEQAREILKRGLLPTTSKLVEEAENGNFQVAKFLYPYLPDLLNPESEEPDIWERLREEDEY